MYVYVHAAYKKLDFIAAVISFIFCGREIPGKPALRYATIPEMAAGGLCVYSFLFLLPHGSQFPFLLLSPI